MSAPSPLDHQRTLTSRQQFALIAGLFVAGCTVGFPGFGTFAATIVAVVAFALWRSTRSRFALIVVALGAVLVVTSVVVSVGLTKTTTETEFGPDVFTVENR